MNQLDQQEEIFHNAIMNMNSMLPKSFDTARPFEFSEYDIRGFIVQTSDSLKGLLKNHNYPVCLKELLAQMQVAVCLMTSIMKFEGEIMLQVRGNGNFKYAFINSNQNHETRGLASFEPPIDDDTPFNELLSPNSILSLHIIPKKGAQYQGIIDISGKNLASCIESYYAQSMQIPTKIWIYSDAQNTQRAAGILIQALPTKDKAKQKEDLEHISILTDTTTMAETLTLDNEQILYRLYNQETTKIYPEKPVYFKCNCSKDYFITRLAHLNPDELSKMLQQDGKITTECHCCGSKYEFNHDEVIEIIRKAKESRH
ncbi:MAG: Hsp33 family molecular chaperone HslO [Ruminobacter sp.]|nr:Hsp33 family molecular chaperone HslO [Ruminobacter sp.]